MSAFKDTAECRSDVIEFDNRLDYYEEEIETRNDIIINDNKFVDKYEIDDLIILFEELKIFC